jgi:hypothetical protein
MATISCSTNALVGADAATVLGTPNLFRDPSSPSSIPLKTEVIDGWKFFEHSVRYFTACKKSELKQDVYQIFYIRLDLKGHK